MKKNLLRTLQNLFKQKKGGELITIKTHKEAGKKSSAKRVTKTALKRGRKKRGLKPKQRLPKGRVFQKEESNPIITPKKDREWESWQTFNPAAVELDGAVHFLYRAIGEDGISRFGYANSHDGFTVNERHPFPAYIHKANCERYTVHSLHSGGSWSGCEDPRMVYIAEDDRIYITYTACDGGLRVGLSSIRAEDFVNKKWRWSKSRLLSPPGEVHKNWVIFPEKINGKYAVLHSISPEITIAYLDSLDADSNAYVESYYNPGKPSEKWDSYVRGAGPPPIKTPYGWLVFYHAMNHRDMGRYKVGAMLLDEKDPTRVLYRSQNPLLEPEEYYEMEGHKGGVVYALGSVIRGGTLFLYYGGADSCVCVAQADCETLLKDLVKGSSRIKRVIKKRILKK